MRERPVNELAYSPTSGLAQARRVVRVPRIRSLGLKLALAFLCVGLLGALLVAFFVGQRTQAAFGQFVNDRGREALVTKLASFYETNEGWNGVAGVVQAEALPAHPGERPPIISLAGADGRLIVADGRFRDQRYVSPADLERATPINVDGTTVGWLLGDWGYRPSRQGSPEDDFLNRVMQALIYGSIGATVVALLLGILLAQTMTRPLRELTVATEALAQGALGQQVAVRSRDELGILATSFNRMSVDLAQASATRRQMTADIAHDLRTPLSVILGYTEALREGKLPATQDVFDTMHTEAQHLQHLIDDLRTLSLADAGELPLMRQPVAPLSLLERVAASAKTQALEQQVTLVVQAAPSLPAVDVDPERMAQVLNNLLNNALRYTPSGGTVKLAAETQERSVRLQVQDTGAGIAAEALPHIFERFYRADPSRQHDGSSGLGLAIVKSIVEAHGGSVAVESTPGHGTTFTITLPA